jgi:hypothetical protein
MLRGGDYACLVQGAGSTARRGIEAEPRLLDLTKHTTEKQSITTHAHNAMHKHMMTCHVYAMIPP